MKKGAGGKYFQENMRLARQGCTGVLRVLARGVADLVEVRIGKLERQLCGLYVKGADAGLCPPQQVLPPLKRDLAPLRALLSPFRGIAAIPSLTSFNAAEPLKVTAGFFESY